MIQARHRKNRRLSGTDRVSQGAQFQGLVELRRGLGEALVD